MRDRGIALLLAAVVAVAWSGLIAPAGAQQRHPPGSAAGRRADDGTKGQEKAVPRAEAPKRADQAPQERRGTPKAEPERHPDRSRPSGPAVRRAPPDRKSVPGGYLTLPHRYYFPPIDVRLGFYYHPYFGFYYGPYYGPFYPYPCPYGRPTRYSVSAIRLRVKPVETEVYVNGYYGGIVDDFDGVFQRLYLPAGEHQLDLRLDGYESFHQNVYVSEGATLDVTHQMRPLRPGGSTGPLPKPRALPEEWTTPEELGTGEQPASPYGVLAIRTEPADARIFIDDEAWDTVAGLPELVIHLPSGSHRLEVRREGYLPFSTRLELSEGQTTRLSVRLER